jgi:hypothetical protein
MIDSKLTDSDLAALKVPAVCSVRLTFFFLRSGYPGRRNPAIPRDAESKLARCGNSPSLRGEKRCPPSKRPYASSAAQAQGAHIP